MEFMGGKGEITYCGYHTNTSLTERSSGTQLQFCQYQSAIRENFSILNVSNVEPRLSGLYQPRSLLTLPALENQIELCFSFFSWHFSENVVQVDIGADFRHAKACKRSLKGVDLL
ncbi:hypothetical protein AVEN_227352-1 [Araneus ventricosus]|uniref:Uncharacterized protein n=1 Tax=Araneus ventricosus TaxID=182803 RepID=A0A4Y2GWF3_ARAVE|nr:hypothetical protein AVEN_227352-1 [Araneus ventricosus]